MGAQSSDSKGRNYDPEAYPDESPVRQEEVRPFAMGRYPVTVLNYLQFVEEGGYGQEKFWTAGGYGEHSEPENWQRQLRYPNRPVVHVSWFEAAAYCAWAGGRLPSEAEWECAARGGREGDRYPWGDEAPDEYRADVGEGRSGQPTPVGLCPEGATPSGIQDLAATCFEWVADWWRENYEGQAEPGERRVFRGGNWVDFKSFRVSHRTGWRPDVRDGVLGFRCVRDVLSV
jgi:formylglycine-generating enzyme required for sulfatase activity